MSAQAAQPRPSRNAPAYTEQGGACWSAGSTCAGALGRSWIAARRVAHTARAPRRAAPRRAAPSWPHPCLGQVPGCIAATLPIRRAWETGGPAQADGRPLVARCPARCLSRGPFRLGPVAARSDLLVAPYQPHRKPAAMQLRANALRASAARPATRSVVSRK